MVHIVHIAKAMVLPIVMYGCESWTIKKAEWTVVFMEILESSLDCRRSNQSILKEINSEYSLEELMLRLKLQYFGKELNHWKRPWCWGRVKAEGEGNDRGWDGWIASLTRWTWVWVNSGGWWWTGRPGLLRTMASQSQIWLSDWTELNWSDILRYLQQL